MPSKSAMRNKKARERNDQVSFLMNKGGRELLRLQALRNGVHVADVLRQAAMAAVGLHTMPATEDVAKLAEVKTPAEAEAAILALQSKEAWAPDASMVEWNNAHPRYRVSVNPDEWEALLNMADYINEQLAANTKTIMEHPDGVPMFDRLHITISAEELILLQRVVANMKKVIPPDNAEE